MLACSQSNATERLSCGSSDYQASAPQLSNYFKAQLGLSSSFIVVSSGWRWLSLSWLSPSPEASMLSPTERLNLLFQSQVVLDVLTLEGEANMEVRRITGPSQTESDYNLNPNPVPIISARILTPECHPKNLAPVHVH